MPFDKLYAKIALQKVMVLHIFGILSPVSIFKLSKV